LESAECPGPKSLMEFLIFCISYFIVHINSRKEPSYKTVAMLLNPVPS
jgi:hypothetical protein